MKGDSGWAAWRLAHPEEELERKRAWRLAHREEELERKRAWYLAHREEERKRALARYYAHRREDPQVRERHRAYRQGIVQVQGEVINLNRIPELRELGLLLKQARKAIKTRQKEAP